MSDSIIDPNNITDFGRGQYGLESFWIFAICVAGKRADQTSTKVQQFIENLKSYADPGDWQSPIKMIVLCNQQRMTTHELKKVKMGQYDRIGRALVHSAELVFGGTIDLRTCTPQDLEQVMGVGPKTSRFFIMHSRADAEVAALDTHILRWLQDIGYDAPKSTPQSGIAYELLEQTFLQEAARRNMKPADLDLKVWYHYSQRQKGIPYEMAE